MKHKLIRTRNGVQTPPMFPSTLYRSFRRDLIDLLDKDDTFKAKYLKDSFESKLVDGEASASPEARRSAAIEKWLKTEERNSLTNRRIMMAEDDDVIATAIGDDEITFGQIVTTARRLIGNVVGHTVDYDLLRGSFSGGASTSIRRGVGTVARKIQEGTDITDMAILPYMQLARSASLLPHTLTRVEGNVLFTVEKTATIDRVACKEPELNMFCQKAVGDFFRRRLLRSGVNLNDQTINQELSKYGSITGDLATIDLSSASDSVTVQTVFRLMPHDWTLTLLSMRSPITLIDGVAHENEMISSMGNGFTFELESLIFWALCRSVSITLGIRGTIGVYGDDMIVPTGIVDTLFQVLSFFGFVVNESKSFWVGSFRESCGKHWFNGQDVTPFYVKRVPLTVPDWCNLLNSLRRWAVVIPGICDPDYYDLWAHYASFLPEGLRGSTDMNRSDALVDPTRRNTYVCRPKTVTDRVTERRYQMGAYAYWLSTNETRTLPCIPGSTSLDLFASNRDLVYRRSPRRKSDTLNIPEFPQEVGDHKTS